MTNRLGTCTVKGRLPDGKPCDRPAVGLGRFNQPRCAKCMADEAMLIHLANSVADMIKVGRPFKLENDN